MGTPAQVANAGGQAHVGTANEGALAARNAPASAAEGGARVSGHDAAATLRPDVPGRGPPGAPRPDEAMRRFMALPLCPPPHSDLAPGSAATDDFLDLALQRGAWPRSVLAPAIYMYI